MKIKSILTRALRTACFSFTIGVYALYALKTLISPNSNLDLSFGLLSGFLLFGALLGLTNSVLDGSKLEGILKRVLHFFATCANLFVSIGLVGEYLIEDPMSNSPLSLPNKILYFLIAYVLIYFICVGIAALIRLITKKDQQKPEEYRSVLDKRS
jgi:hypothetical protein